MESMLIKELYNHIQKYMDTEIEITGWVRNNRNSKTHGFIELNDGTYFKNIQIVYDESLSNFEEILKLKIGSSVRIKGKVVKSLGDKQLFEIKAISIEIEGICQETYPLQKKKHSFEYLREIAHLRPRTNTFYAVFRIRSLVAQAIHQFFYEKGFVYVHTPIITGSDCEGAGEMFKVTTLDLDKLPKTEESEIDYKEDFFKKPTKLTVSGQLSGETFSMAFRNIYTFGPTFRAENSNTTRHASEFWMVEPEISFADLNDCLRLEEEMLKYLIKFVMENAKDELEFLNTFIDNQLIERLENVLNSDFAVITYTEAIQILSKAEQKFEYPVEWGLDIKTEHERYITEKYFKKPVFVTDYPKDIKAFYMRVNDDGKTVAGADLLVPGIGEIIGGSQREERLDILLDRIKELGLKQEEYEWYLDTRRYGTVKHAGFGLGFERCIMYLTGMSNIRDVIPFPRTVGNIDF